MTRCSSCASFRRDCEQAQFCCKLCFSYSDSVCGWWSNMDDQLRWTFAQFDNCPALRAPIAQLEVGTCSKCTLAQLEVDTCSNLDGHIAQLEVCTCSTRSGQLLDAKLTLAQLEVDTCSTRSGNLSRSDHLLNSQIELEVNLLSSKTCTLAQLDTCSRGHLLKYGQLDICPSGQLLKHLLKWTLETCPI